jgi:hypothetical protein
MARRRRKPAPAVPPEPVGVDGWSIYPDSASEQVYEEARSRRVEQARLGNDLAFLRACERAVVKEQYFPALMDALAFCRGRNLLLPPWLHGEIWAILDRVYHAKKKIWKRHEAETARREKHYRRYDAVQELLDRRDEPNPRHDLGVTRENVFEKAGSHLGESAPAVQASYWKWKRASESPDGPPYVAQYRWRGSVKKRRKKR